VSHPDTRAVHAETPHAAERRDGIPGLVSGASDEAPGIAIGTSGWSYRHWRERFYPSGLPASRWLPYYAEHFDTVEINATFYRLPSEHAVRRWRAAVPSGFSFAVKGSRLITHARRLQHADEAVARFVERISPLGESLGCILWQLPPGFVPELEVLDRFLHSVPSEARQAVELRRVGAPDPALLSLLADHSASYVCTSSPDAPGGCPVTSDLVYVRFHGLSGGYAHAYTVAELRPWACFLAEARSQGRSALVYFNNDAEGHAPEDAAKLRTLV
jgi:uncharacterized protein YecE (DUF72 family)